MVRILGCRSPAELLDFLERAAEDLQVWNPE